MARPPDQEITYIEKIVCWAHIFQGEGTHLSGKRQGWSGVKREKEQMQIRAFSVVSVESDRQGGVVRFRTD